MARLVAGWPLDRVHQGDRHAPALCRPSRRHRASAAHERRRRQGPGSMAAMSEQARTRSRSPAAGAAIGLVTGALALAALALAVANRDSPAIDPLSGLSPAWSMAVRATVQTVGILTLAAAGGLVMWRQPQNAFSRLLAVTIGVLAVGVCADEYAIFGLVIHPGSVPLADLAAVAHKVLPDVV